MSKPQAEKILADARAYLDQAIERGSDVVPWPRVRAEEIIALATDNFALSQQGGVGARYGVSPPDGGTAGVEAWFSDKDEAESYAEDWEPQREVWDLVLGQKLQ